MEKTALQQFIDDILSGKIIVALSNTHKYLDLEKEQHTRIYKGAWDNGYNHTSVPASTYLATVFNGYQPTETLKVNWKVGDWAWANSSRSVLGIITSLTLERASIHTQELIYHDLFVDEFIPPTKQEIEAHLIGLATKKYPIGTKIRSVLDPTETYVVQGDFSYNFKFNILYARRQDGNKNYAVWKNGVWAETIPVSMIDEAISEISKNTLSSSEKAISILEDLASREKIIALAMLEEVDEEVTFRKALASLDGKKTVAITKGYIYPCVYQIGRDSFAIIDNLGKIRLGFDIGCFSSETFTFEEYLSQHKQA